MQHCTLTSQKTVGHETCVGFELPASPMNSARLAEIVLQGFRPLQAGQCPMQEGHRRSDRPHTAAWAGQIATDSRGRTRPPSPTRSTTCLSRPWLLTTAGPCPNTAKHARRKCAVASRWRARPSRSEAPAPRRRRPAASPSRAGRTSFAMQRPLQTNDSSGRHQHKDPDSGSWHPSSTRAPITFPPAPLGLFQKPNRNIDGDNRRTLGEPRDERETF